MDILVAIAEIQGRVKAYESCTPKMYQGTFSRTIADIKAGRAKQSTIDNFMAKFGYVKIPEQWEKI